MISRGRRFLLAVAALALMTMMLTLVAAVEASASQPLEAGNAFTLTTRASSDFVQHLVVVEVDPTTSSFIGIAVGTYGIEQVRGTFHGGSVSFTSTYENLSYTATLTGTLSTAGGSGHLHDTNGHVGSWEAVPLTLPPANSSMVRPGYVTTGVAYANGASYPGSGYTSSFDPNTGVGIACPLTGCSTAYTTYEVYTGDTLYTVVVEGGYVSWGYQNYNPSTQQLAGDFFDSNGAHGTSVDHFTSRFIGATTTSSAALPIASSIPTPGQAFGSIGHVLASGAITAGALLFITFPSQLFNKTFEENYDVIMEFWERRLPSLKRIQRALKTDQAKEASGHDFTLFAVVAVIGAFLGSLLTPSFGLNSHSIEGFIASLINIAFGVLAGYYVNRTYRRIRNLAVQHYFDALPAGLLIALACVVVSRLSGFEPGYLYGVVCAVAFSGKVDKKAHGHLIALGTLVTLGIAVVAWLATVPLNHLAAEPNPFFGWVILDDIAGSLFVGGVVGSVINLLPLRFLAGRDLAAWSKTAWALVAGVSLFAFVEILVRPAHGGHSGKSSLALIIVLFVLFGGGSLLFREYFARRQRREELMKIQPRLIGQQVGNPESTSDLPDHGDDDHGDRVSSEFAGESNEPPQG